VEGRKPPVSTTGEKHKYMEPILGRSESNNRIQEKKGYPELTGTHRSCARKKRMKRE
jgi:hypothetical protein